MGREPRQFQFAVGLWTRVIGGELIRQKFGVVLTPPGVGKLLRRLGLSPPLQDPAAVRRWRPQEVPAIRRQARAAGAQR